MPDFSIFERQILSASEKKEMFVEKFEEMANIYPSAIQQIRSPSSLGMLTASDGDMETRPTTYIDLAPGRNINKLVNGRITINRDSHEFETKVVYNGIPVPIKVPVAIMPETVGDVCTSLFPSLGMCITAYKLVFSNPPNNNLLPIPRVKPPTIRSPPPSHYQWPIHTPIDSVSQRSPHTEKDYFP